MPLIKHKLIFKVNEGKDISYSNNLYIKYAEVVNRYPYKMS